MTRGLVKRYVAGFAAACLVGGVVAAFAAIAPAYAQDSSTTTSTPAASSIVLGDGNSDSAVVTGDATFGSPTGTVTFYDCFGGASPAPCTSQANQVDIESLTAGANNTSNASSVSFTPTSTGYWCFAAYYSGDSNYGSSDDSTTTDGCFDVTSVPSTTTSTPATSSIVLGNGNSDSAVVAGDATFGSPTGTVTFYDCFAGASPAPCTSQANQVGGSAVSLTGGANNTSSASSVTFTPTSTGYWCFAAYYSGDSNYGSSDDSTTTDGCFDVTTASSTTTTAPASSTIVFGNTDSDTASVAGNAAGGAPTGTVTFYYCYAGASPSPCTSKLNKVGSGPVTLTPGANDTSSATSGTLNVADTGYYCFGAYYSGSSNYQASSDTAVAECFDVVPPAPTITSFTPASGAPGSTVKIFGTNLSAAISVTFKGGLAGTIKSDTGSEIKVKVPAGAHNGYIVVTTAGGTVQSATKFKVT